jgi:tetratricopeptide (TPR) repeat protein
MTRRLRHLRRTAALLSGALSMSAVVVAFDASGMTRLARLEHAPVVLRHDEGRAAAAIVRARSVEQPVSVEAGQEPDRLYADRAQLTNAFAAAAIWEARLKANPRDFESAWKLSRAGYWLGAHVPAKERRAHYERGVEAGRRATEIEPKRPEGYFWMAANMGTMAESFGLRLGLKYRGPVKRALETVLALDPGYQQGSADRALGRWYLRVPGWLGGSKQKSVDHLLHSLTYDSTSAASHFFLAETYLEMNRDAEARRELQMVIDAPLHPEWTPEVREFQTRARVMLDKLR